MAGENNLKNEILKLVELQGIDAQIFDLKAELEELPEEVKRIDSIVETKKSGIKKAEEDLKTVQVTKNQKENEVKTIEEKIKKYESELNNVKTNKEYKALLTEIETLKADISVIEETILGYFDKIDQAESGLNDEKKKFEEEKKTNDVEKNNINEKIKIAETSLKELEAKRKSISDNVKPEVLFRYEKILANRGRVAIAKVSGQFCGACNMTLRPQKINEAHLLKEIVFCEMCGRILYAEKED